MVGRVFESRLPMRGHVEEFDIQHIPERDLRIIRVADNIQFADFSAFAAVDKDVKIPRFTIWHLSTGALRLLSMTDMKGLKDLDWGSRPDGQDEHVIVVAQDPAEQILAKWYKLFSETLPSQGVTYYAANSLSEAEDIVDRVSGRAS